jgi:hypothetical protein
VFRVISRGGATVVASIAVCLAFVLVATPRAARGAGTIDPCLISPTACSTLTIAPRGEGGGEVDTTQTFGGALDLKIHCLWYSDKTTGDCAERYWVGVGKTLTVYVMSDPYDGSKVCSQANGCTTAAVNTSVTLTAGTDRSFSAQDPVDFEYVSPEHLTVAKSGTGTGTIVSAPAGIQCGATCERNFGLGQELFLSVELGPNTELRGWSVGPCSGQGNPCHLTMPPSDTTITALLVDTTPTLPPPPTPVGTMAATAGPTGGATSIPSHAASAGATAAPTTPETSPEPGATGPDGSPTSSDAGVASAGAGTPYA